MTKIDRNKYTKDGECVEDGSDAVSALRGYVKSDLVNSAVVFSAGLNPRVYSYLENCNAFDANENGVFDTGEIGRNAQGPDTWNCKDSF